MKYIELRDSLKRFAVFSLADIKKIDSNFHRRRLNEWQEKGYIKKVIRGFYIFSDFELSEHILFEIANKIYKPSYISLETALSYYHLIPESVYSVTSVSTRRTYNFKTALAEFSYRTIKPDLFFGFDLVNYNEKHFKIASPEKAVLDYFYINPVIKKESDFESLRINSELFLKEIKLDRLYNFLDKFHQKSLTGRINSFLRVIKNA